MDPHNHQQNVLLGMARLVFQTLDGQRIDLVEKCGHWYAMLVDGEEVPVFCAQQGELAAALDAMRLWPAKRGQQQIHLMRLVELDGLKRFVYLGEQALEGHGQSSSSDQREPSSSDHAGTSQNTEFTQEREQERCEPIALGRIATIRDLVKALNSCGLTDEKQRRASLCECVRKCKRKFEGTNFGDLAEEKGVAIKEYSSLAGIKTDSPEKEELLKEIFPGLCDKLKNEDFRDNLLMEAVSFSLCKMHSGVFDNDPDWLLKLANSLLDKLTGTGNRHSEAYHAKNHLLFCALLRTLGFVGKANQSQWDLSYDKSLIDRFTKSFRKIDEASGYYPTRYHVLVLEQSLVRLVSGECTQKVFQSVWNIFQGIADLHQFVCLSCVMYHIPFGIVTFGTHIDKAKSGVNRIKDAFAEKGIRRKDWYDWIMNMNAACAKHLTTSERSVRILQCLEDIKTKERLMKAGHDRLVVRFGIVQQLCVLVLDGLCAGTRKESLQELLLLATAWQRDIEVLKEILEGLVRIIEKYGCQGGEKLAAEMALKILPTSQGDRSFWDIKEILKKGHEVREAIEKVKEVWKKGIGQIVEFQPAVSHSSSGLWHEVIRGSLGGQAHENAVSFATTLKDYYMDDVFASIPSFLGGEGNRKHVTAMDCQLVCIEPNKIDGSSDGGRNCLKQAELNKSPIDLNDLFGSTVTKSGEDQCEIQRVFVEGQAGSGKTALSHMLAYKWAEGNWYMDSFDHVYVLPVRELQESSYSNFHKSFRCEATLATAIANICFVSYSARCGEEQYNVLRSHINKTLDSPRTLVVLDGLDEQDGVNEKMLEQAELGSATHKLLMLSRPHSMEAARKGRRVEHVGLSHEQIEAFVKSKLSEELGKDLLTYLVKQPAIGSAAHVPLNLEILCHLWQDEDERETIIGEKESGLGYGSLPLLYRTFCNYLWSRNVHKFKGQGLDRDARDALFANLGKIALGGKLEFTEGFIKTELDQDRVFVDKLIELAGFLLTKAQNMFSFPHRTFQEYLGGRLLANHLLSEDENERKEAKMFISKERYNKAHRLVLLFMAGEISHMRRVTGIQIALDAVNSEPREVVGVQHLLLQLQLVQEWLCVAKDDTEAEFAALNRDNQLVSSARKVFGGCRCFYLFKKEFENCADMHLLMETLQRSPTILAHAPELIQTILDRASVCSLKASFVSSVSYCRPAVSAFWHHLISGGAGQDRHHNGISIGYIWVYLLMHRRGMLNFLHFQRGLLPNVVLTSDMGRELEQLVSLGSSAVQLVLERLGHLLEGVSDSVLTGVCRCFDLIECERGPKAEKIFMWRKRMSIATGRDFVQRLDMYTMYPHLFCNRVYTPMAPNLIRSFREETEENPVRAIRNLGVLLAAHQSLPSAEWEYFVIGCSSENVDTRSEALDVLSGMIEANNVPDGMASPDLIRACNDKNGDARRKAITAFAEIGQVAASHAETAFDHLVHCACDTQDRETRNEAIRVLVRVVEVNETIAPNLLDRLTNLCNDADPSVRKEAVRSAGWLVMADGSMADSAFNHLILFCSDNNKAVKNAAIRVVGEVVKADVSTAQAALDRLTHACTQKETDWKIEVIGVLERIAKADGSAARKALDFLIFACRDINEDAKKELVRALGWIVITDGSIAPVALQHLIDACRDKHRFVRTEAILILGRVAAAACSSAQTALNQLIDLCHGCNSELKFWANRVLGEVAEAKPCAALTVFDQFTQACYDENPGVREYAVRGFGQVVKVDGSTAQAALNYLVHASNDAIEGVRRKAIVSIGNVAKADRTTAQTALHHLIHARREEETYIELETLDVIRDIVKTDGPTAQIVLDQLIQAYNERGPIGKVFDILAIGNMVNAVGSTPQRALNHLIYACKDMDATVRKAAIRTMAQVHKASGFIAQSALGSLIQACNDEHADVKLEAVLVLEHLVEGSRSIAKAALDVGAPSNVVQNPDSASQKLRDAAVRFLGHLVKEAPSNTQSILPFIFELVEHGNQDTVMTCSRAIDGVPAKELIRYFLNMGKSAVVPFLVKKLHAEALVILESSKEDFKRLSLHSPGQNPISWDEPVRIVEYLQQLINQNLPCT